MRTFKIVYLLIGICILAAAAVGIYFLVSSNEPEDEFIEQVEGVCEEYAEPKDIQEILKYTNFNGLLQLAEINKNFSDLAAVAFKEKYATERIQIGFSYPKDSDKSIIESATILKTLKHFGKSISLLDLFCAGIEERYSRVITQLINNCSSNSLLDFSMNNCGGTVWQDLTNPFENVKNVSYSIASGDAEDDFVPFNKLFPNIVALTLSNFKAKNGSHADCNFPYLQYLALQRIQNDEFDTSFEQVIRKNPQIQIFGAYNLSPKFLQFVSINLPNVQSLQLSKLVDGTEEIQFSNVKAFTGINVAPQNLNFPNLENVQIKTLSKDRESFIQFMAKHPQIKKLTILRGSDLDNKVFHTITENLNKINDVSIDDGQMIATQTIINFLETHTTLQTFSIVYCEKADKKIYEETLKATWNINNFMDCLSFTRKK